MRMHCDCEPGLGKIRLNTPQEPREIVGGGFFQREVEILGVAADPIEESKRRTANECYLFECTSSLEREENVCLKIFRSAGASRTNCSTRSFMSDHTPAGTDLGSAGIALRSPAVLAPRLAPQS